MAAQLNKAFCEYPDASQSSCGLRSGRHCVLSFDMDQPGDRCLTSRTIRCDGALPLDSDQMGTGRLLSNSKGVPFDLTASDHACVSRRNARRGGPVNAPDAYTVRAVNRLRPRDPHSS